MFRRKHTNENTFLVPIEKELDTGKAIKYKIKFIDNFRFILSLISNLVDDLSEGLHNDSCTDCKFYFGYMSIKNNQSNFRCFGCKKNYNKDFNKALIKRFANMHEFCDRDNKSILLLRKGICPYEYMYSWGRFDEALLPKKKDFYSSLNMENITSFDYRHAKRAFKISNNKNIDDYFDLYVWSDTFLLADVFENFRNKCIEIYEIDPANVLSAPELAWQACLMN